MNEYIDLKKFRKVATDAYPANHLYCLVDHAGMPGLHSQLMRARVPWSNLFAGSQEQAALQVAPLLFLIDDECMKEHSRLLSWVAQHGTYTSCMLLLSSPLSLNELGHRLARRVHFRISEQTDVLLRFFDPRVFEALASELAPPQRKAFLGVADCWWYINRSGDLRQQLAGYDPDDAFNTPMLLSAQQEFALVEASEVDQVAAQVQATVPDVYIRMGAPQRVSFLRRQMAAANAAGVSGTHDVALYCGLALLYGEDFALEPSWQETFTKVHGGARLSDAVAEEDA